MALDLIDRVEYNTESFIPKNIVIMLISSIYTIFFNLFLSDVIILDIAKENNCKCYRFVFYIFRDEVGAQ